VAISLFQVDAFTDTPYGGNPAAVCLLDAPAPDGWMQDVAAEMNLSETAFTWPEGEARRLRWFTPCVEVDLCGHATLATAHVLFARGGSGASSVRFLTRSGELSAARRRDWIELDFPALPVREATAPAGLQEALGAVPVAVGESRFDCVVELESEEAVRGLRPDFAALLALDARGVIVTSRGARYDFVSRCFFPKVGVDEDPVTGSAHCALAPYWAERLGRAEMTGYQASARGGVVRVRLAGDRVFLGGRAVTVVEGNLVVAPDSTGSG
jgi:predicted PhzF superfamily epimerase YddE/YHI9